MIGRVHLGPHFLLPTLRPGLGTYSGPGLWSRGRSSCFSSLGLPPSPASFAEWGLLTSGEGDTLLVVFLQVDRVLVCLGLHECP